MRSRYIGIVFFIVALLFSCSNSNSSKEVQHIKKTKLLCYFFFIPDCPACKSSFSKISELQNKYAGHGLQIIAVYADPLPDTLELKNTLKNYNFDLPIVYDTSLALCKKFGAKITPQVILLNEKEEVLYSGLIDNYYISLGKHRSLVTKKYLDTAIVEALDNKIPAIKSTVPVGCKINYSLRSGSN